MDEKDILDLNIKRLKATQSLAQIGSWELDLTTNELFWSDEIYELFEIDKTKFEASYEGFLNAIHPEDRKLVNDTYLNSLKTKEKYTIQHRLLMKDGRIKYVEERGISHYNKNGEPIRSMGTVQDITNLKEVKKELEKTISYLKGYELAMNESSIVTKSDLKGNITFANENFCNITGYTQEEVIGKPHNIIRDPQTDKKVFQELWSTIQAKKVWKGILKNIGKLGPYWVDITILPILDEKNEIIEYIAIRHDITKMINQQKNLDELANTDSLTRLGNRYKLTNDIKQSTKPALAILNIDNFSQINDFYGHEIGDKIIKKIANKLISIVDNKNYCLYHLQGDEYVVFNKDIDKEIFNQKIHNVFKKLKNLTLDIDEERLNFNFTIGVSFEESYRVLSTADMALKVARRENKDMLVYSEDISLNKEYEENIKWAKKVKKALDTDNIIPVFQPIVNNTTNKWEKYESLVRLQEDDKLISPFFFLEISKKSKHYTDITKRMINKSFTMFKARQEEFSINLTIEDILNNDIQTYIFKMLEEYKNGSRVVFEIVESESIKNFAAVEEFINIVKSYGCKIAIDDFGTGYSNFEYLMKLKADYIKIDGSMIKDIDTNTNAQIVVSVIVEFAKKMNIKTIAEFVENEAVLNKVKELGIDYSQGYHFSPPSLELKN